ncbi:MAG: nucleotide exchange factor GrpE [Candidatus Liptonbacteria bacterium]|nr:nucleotide exchange factor GrpE [Candidatus Liptonbacteria bacterium]
MDEDKKKEEDKKTADDAVKKPEPALEEKLAECEKQRDEYLGGWQRARADFLNYKKDEVRRFEELARFSTEDMLKQLISVLDSFDLGLAALEKAGKAEKGIYMIRSQLEDILKQRGLERISVKIGEQFNPMTAEAIAETESDQPAGAVIEEIEPGYRLYDKIVRPARVKIAKRQET